MVTKVLQTTLGGTRGAVVGTCWRATALPGAPGSAEAVVQPTTAHAYVPLTMGEGLLRRTALFAEQASWINQPEEPVYSRAELVPAGQQGKVTTFFPDSVGRLTRDAHIDARHLRFIHTLSEGKAARLVAGRIRSMRKILADWQRRCPGDWPLRGQEILAALTKGDRHGKDPIRVGVYGNSYFLLNGHRRMAALHWMAGQGEIPLGWLNSTPVLLHEIRDEKDVLAITAGCELNPLEVLREIEIDGVSSVLGSLVQRLIVTPGFDKSCLFREPPSPDIQPYRRDDFESCANGIARWELERLFSSCIHGRARCFLSESDAIFQYLFPHWVHRSATMTAGPFFDYWSARPHLDAWMINAWPITETAYQHHATFLTLLYRSDPGAVADLIRRWLEAKSDDYIHHKERLTSLASALGIDLA